MKTTALKCERVCVFVMLVFVFFFLCIHDFQLNNIIFIIFIILWPTSKRFSTLWSECRSSAVCFIRFECILFGASCGSSSFSLGLLCVLMLCLACVGAREFSNWKKKRNFSKLFFSCFGCVVHARVRYAWVNIFTEYLLLINFWFGLSTDFFLLFSVSLCLWHSALLTLEQCTECEFVNVFFFLVFLFRIFLCMSFYLSFVNVWIFLLFQK